jgi:cytochrome P450
VARSGDILSPAARSDPHEIYRTLREAEPVSWNERLGMWLVASWQDVERVVTKTAEFSVERFRAGADDGGTRAPGSVLRSWAVYRDPPDHTRLRRLLSRSFSPDRLEALRPRIATIVDSLLDDAATRGAIDFVGDFAFPLPATVIASMLGVPSTDLAKLRLWSRQISEFVGGSRSGADGAHAQEGLLQTCAYFRALSRGRRGRPGDEVLGALLDAQEQPEGLTEEEVVANCVLLLFAGHETTANLLSLGLWHLLHHPEQESHLRRHPELIPGFVEETLRFDAPVAGTIRIARADVRLGAHTLRCGDQVAAMLASAGRDAERFARPDDFDVTRSGVRHLAFGQGIHFCLGAGLARLEAEIAFAALLERFGTIRLGHAEPRWKRQVFFRGLEELPLMLQR